MKFTIINVYTVEHIGVVITHGDRSVTYDLRSVLSKTDKENLTSKTLWKPLEDYLTYRGNEYCELLMDKYISLQDALVSGMISSNSYDSSNKLKEIISIIDIPDMVKFLKGYSEVTAPPNLKDEFKEEAGSSMIRIQTYTRNEYYELTALVLSSKILIGPLGEFASMMSYTLQKNMTEFSLMNLIKDEESLFESAPMIKLKGVMNNMYTIAGSKTSSIPMTRLIPSEDIPTWLLSLAYIKHMSKRDITMDNSAKNTITIIYNTVNNTINENPNVANTVKDKKPSSDGDEMESFMEAYRTSSDVAPGTVVEFNWAVSDPYRTLNDLGLGEHKDLLKHALKFLEPMVQGNTVPDATVHIVSWIIDKVLDARCIWHLNIRNLVNVIAVGFVYCQVNNCIAISLLLTTIDDRSEDTRLSQSISKSKVKKEVIEGLVESNYNLERIVETSKNRTVGSPIVGAIKLISESYFSSSLVYLAPNEYLGNLSKHTVVPSDLKPQLAELMIMLDM